VKKSIIIAVLFLVLAGGSLLLLMQNSKYSNDRNRPIQTNTSSSDGSGSKSTSEFAQTATVTDKEKETIQSKCIEVSRLYQKIYQLEKGAAGNGCRNRNLECLGIWRLIVSTASIPEQNTLLHLCNSQLE